MMQYFNLYTRETERDRKTDRGREERQRRNTDRDREERRTDREREKKDRQRQSRQTVGETKKETLTHIDEGMERENDKKYTNIQRETTLINLKFVFIFLM